MVTISRNVKKCFSWNSCNRLTKQTNTCSYLPPAGRCFSLHTNSNKGLHSLAKSWRMSNWHLSIWAMIGPWFLYCLQGLLLWSDISAAFLQILVGFPTDPLLGRSWCNSHWAYGIVRCTCHRETRRCCSSKFTKEFFKCSSYLSLCLWAVAHYEKKEEKSVALIFQKHCKSKHIIPKLFFFMRGLSLSTNINKYRPRAMSLHMKATPKSQKSKLNCLYWKSWCQNCIQQGRREHVVTRGTSHTVNFPTTRGAFKRIFQL